MSKREPKFGSVRDTLKTAAPPWPYSGFITTSPYFERNLSITARSRVKTVGGIKSANSITKIFSGAFLTFSGSFTTRTSD